MCCAMCTFDACMCVIVWTGVRRERCSYRGARHRRNPQIRDGLGEALGVGGCSQHNLEIPLNPTDHLFSSGGRAEGCVLSFSPEQLVNCILEAEPPQIFLKEPVKKPYTEASMMMSLTTLADKELVLMISWAKKIPGVCACINIWNIHLIFKLLVYVKFLGQGFTADWRSCHF